ncbi:MAG: type II toxin-antitoxin system HicA family toxin [Candidatus Aenigmarchaeota archaeon]|nr:type II toxin-antitoxin system HicA family toxin [Candidatus Aenigmarchaeota archaeon]
MTKLVPISPNKLIKILENLGFRKVHQVGSHIRFIHPDGRRTTVIMHGNEEIGAGLLSDILKQVGLSKEEYEKLRREV